MRVKAAFAAVSLIAVSGFTTAPSNSPWTQEATTKPPVTVCNSHRIQVAILLDVSGSMSGLIEQAKIQLWNMVTTLGRAKCGDAAAPQFELALYEYGRSSNDVKKGYVKQLSPFTSDLDQVSSVLFSLNTNGGDEYCGEVIHTSMDELAWDKSNGNYKVIFIAGNEDFLQGKLHYTQACAKANAKGVIVNTIYCGDYQQGIREHWNLAGECGNGSYSHINHNSIEDDIATPWDTTLIVLNKKLNSTYIGYGTAGAANTVRQEQVDEMNGFNNKAYFKRAEAKAQSNVYGNASWDLVDAYNAQKDILKKIEFKTLPDSLRNKTVSELEVLVRTKSAERIKIQKQIMTVSASRNSFIAAEKAKKAGGSKESTLETVIDKALKEQVRRVKMVIE